MRANKWGFDPIRKLSEDFPKVLTMELRSELTGGRMERTFEGGEVANLKVLPRKGNVARVRHKLGPTG